MSKSTNDLRRRYRALKRRYDRLFVAMDESRNCEKHRKEAEKALDAIWSEMISIAKELKW